jgi:hypothetical protein
VVEAKFYGDGTWNKAILGELLGSERQKVMFVGYEADGWQETACKDIRYPAMKLGGGGGSSGGKAKGSTAAGGTDGEQGTPKKAQEKKVKEGKASKGGRSGKKWEVGPVHPLHLPRACPRACLR